MTPARIAYLLEYPTLSGGERSLLSLLDHLPRDRFHPVLFCPEEGPLFHEIEQRGLEHHSYSLVSGGRRRPFEEVTESLSGLLRDQGIALLHANSLSCGEYSGMLGQSAEIPSVAHIRDIQKLKNSRRRRLALNDRLITVSHATRKHLISQALDGDKIVPIWNGIGADFGASDELSQRLAIPESALVLANIGQICLRKAQNLCLEALEPLLLAKSEVHLLIIGERFSKKAESVAFEQALHDRVARQGLESRVHFLAYRDDVPALLKRVDILVHTALQEPLGRVLLEAQVSGLPVVAFDVGGNAEVIEHERTGFLVNLRDIDQFRQSVQRLLEESSTRRAMGEEARRLALTRFCPKRSLAKVLEVYQDLLQRLDIE